MIQENVSKSVQTPMVITCEHGGNQIPSSYRHLFQHCRTLLDSHRGFDFGALTMAKTLARYFGVPLLTSRVSRVVVDLNRSIGHRNLHLEAVQKLPAEVRQEIIEQYYQPYRNEAEQLITQGIILNGKVIHLSCHSFTNSLNGVTRHADVGLLYDSARQRETTFCAEWKSALRVLAPNLKVRRNFPYKGCDDGFTTALRKKFPANAYLGIELELNQKNLLLPPKQWAALRTSIVTSLSTTLRNHNL